MSGHAVAIMAALMALNVNLGGLLLNTVNCVHDLQLQVQRGLARATSRTWGPILKDIQIGVTTNADHSMMSDPLP